MSDKPQPSHPDGPPDPNESLNLLGLPEEVVLVIVEYVLALDLPACLRLRQCCKTLREVIDAPQAGGGRSVRAEAEARRLRWEEVMHHEISANGQVLTGVKDPNSIGIMIWAHGPLLPVTGKSSWAIKLEQGHALIGVCDAAGLNTWSLKLDHGCLYRCQRDANGRTVFSQPPPDGWPDGTPVRVMKDEAGNPTSLVGRATIGAVIEVLVNHGEGVLSYRINGGPVLEALKGFPKGATGQLRPWVQLVHGRVRFKIPYLSHVP